MQHFTANLLTGLVFIGAICTTNECWECWKESAGKRTQVQSGEKTATIRADLLSALKCSMAQDSEAGRGCNALLEITATRATHRTSALCQAGQEAKPSHRCFNLQRDFQRITSKVSSLLFSRLKNDTAELCSSAEWQSKKQTLHLRLCGAGNHSWNHSAPLTCTARSSTQPWARGTLEEQAGLLGEERCQLHALLLLQQHHSHH